MRDLSGKVAVVTGAASGIGRAMAERFAREGMKVVLADVEPEPLARAEAALRAGGASVLAVPVDVSDGAAVERLAERTLERFGAVHLVCNNAGVNVVKRCWDFTVEDWQWVLGVNLWGVIHGIRVFVPILLRQQTEGHVVNTASMAGLVTLPGIGCYTASKHAVVGLSEVLAKELQNEGAPVRVSVLCPGLVQTNLGDAARNRPAQLGGTGAEDRTLTAGAVAAPGIAPEAVAEQVLAAVREERFYILTHPERTDGIRERVEDLLAGRYPHP